jgi:molybdopterin converting factor small subunit
VSGRADPDSNSPPTESKGREQVTIEVVAWVTSLVGGDGTRRKRFIEAVESGATVESVLRQFSRRFPRLADALWDRRGGGLAEHIEVMMNDAVLGVTHSLGSPVKDGDRITLVGAFIGG